MKIDLDQLEQQPEAFECRFDLEPERLDPSQVAGTFTVELTGEVRRREPGWQLTATLAGSGTLLCSRCLEPVPWQVDESLDLSLLPAGEVSGGEDVELEDDDLDVVFVSDRVIDLTDVAAEQLMLALPMRVLCREECAGLCPSCGADLNRGEECSCEPEDDPRWAKLRDLAGPPS